MGYLRTSLQYREYTASDVLVIDECRFGQDLEISGSGLIEVLSLQSHLEELRKPTRIAGAPAKIRTEGPQNIFLECCLQICMHVALEKCKGNATDAIKDTEKNTESREHQIVVFSCSLYRYVPCFCATYNIRTAVLQALQEK